MDTKMATGYKTAGVAAGIKKNGEKDLGLIVSDEPAAVAGVFTQNHVKAAPVLLDQERIQSGTCRAVVVNSGNANCCTAAQGMKDALAMARSAADALEIDESEVLVASTGVIGEPLPIDRIADAMQDLIDGCAPDTFADFSEAIMTTDTVPKVVSKQGKAGGKPYTITGTAKGAGMIRPDMATLLVFVCTDAGIDAERLKESLRAANAGSFNRISVDGDTSTNDTVLLMANGASGAAIESKADRQTFQGVLNDVLLELAKMIVRDGEGATKLVAIVVRNAESAENARTIADTVSHSNLVKTALFGEDANWGRILAAAGRAGVPLSPNNVDIYFDKVQMVAQGSGRGKDVEAEATKVLKKDEFSIVIDLNAGGESASVLTCDFSIDYVKINADYRT